MFFRKKAKANINSTTTDELQNLRSLQSIVQSLITAREEAIADLDGVTSQHVELLYQRGELTQAKYNQLKPAVEALEQIVRGHQGLILKAQVKYSQEYERLSKTHDLSGFPKPTFFPFC